MITQIIAKKKFGQNFLQDKNIIHKIFLSCKLKDDSTVVEIGPGLGALTQEILSVTKNVNVIEFDKEVIPYLIENTENTGDLTIFNADVLKFDFSKISADNFYLIGNLPYNISSAILIKIIDIANRIEKATFMLQKEMVDRISAQPNNKTYGRLSVVMQYFFECEGLFVVPPDVFYPKPKVDSRIIRLTPRKIERKVVCVDAFLEVVKKSFSQRRKTLYNNLKQMLTDNHIDKDKIDIDFSLRAENLSVDDFVLITNSIKGGM